jgi:hypothetical protein
VRKESVNAAFFFIVLGVLALLAFLVVLPVLDFLLLGLLLALGFQPVHAQVLRVVPRRALAAVVTLFIVAVIVARAANVLPVPGSTLVRIAALKQQGTGYRRAFTATATVAAAWISATFLLAGALLAVLTGSVVGLAAVGVGLAALGATHTLVVFHVGSAQAASLTVRVAAVDLLLVAVSALRLFWVLMALGFLVAVPQAAALTVAEVLASATGVFPGGLGIREVVAGVISPVVGLPIALGVIAAAGDRLLDYALLAPACVVMLLMARRDRGQPILRAFSRPILRREHDQTTASTLASERPWPPDPTQGNAMASSSPSELHDADG